MDIGWNRHSDSLTKTFLKLMNGKSHAIMQCVIASVRRAVPIIDWDHELGNEVKHEHD